jgi:hypothetical protein
MHTSKFLEFTFLPPFSSASTETCRQRRRGIRVRVRVRVRVFLQTRKNGLLLREVRVSRAQEENAPPLQEPASRIRVCIAPILRLQQIVTPRFCVKD